MSSYPMEGPGPRGFGWDYPPGTTGSAEAARVRCADCGALAEVTVVSELGASWTEPEECPKCGGKFDHDSTEEYDPREEAKERRFDALREDGEL